MAEPGDSKEAVIDGSQGPDFRIEGLRVLLEICREVHQKTPVSEILHKSIRKDKNGIRLIDEHLFHGRLILVTAQNGYIEAIFPGAVVSVDN